MKIRDRFYLVTGATLSLIAAIVLLFTTHRLGDVVAVEVSPGLREGLSQTLTVIVWFACAGGIGLCLTSYGLAVADCHRALTTPAKRSLVLGSIVYALAGGLIYITFRDLQTQLNVLAADSLTRVDALIDMAKDVSRRMLSAFCAFLSAEMLTMIGISSLFLGEALPKARRTMRVSILAASLSTIIGFTCTLLLAAWFGASVMNPKGATDDETALSIANSIQWQTNMMMLAGAALAVFGVFRTLQALIFPKKDHA